MGHILVKIGKQKKFGVEPYLSPIFKCIVCNYIRERYEIPLRTRVSLDMPTCDDHCIRDTLT